LISFRQFAGYDGNEHEIVDAENNFQASERRQARPNTRFCDPTQLLHRRPNFRTGVIEAELD
jgi:hypothetical protein